MEDKEKKFYDTLESIFVGAKVEGDSGYINLMKIKSKYYQNCINPKLKNDIENALNQFPGFKEELFDKLYTFFSRYFSESGSIYFRFTPFHQDVYEKVYTNDKDVILFWKTHMLYYVKTDILFKSMSREIDGFKFFFDVSNLQHKKANEKREIIYEFKEKRDNGEIVFNVSYKEGNNKTNIEEILKAIENEGIKISEDTLERAFKTFEKQSKIDYFINKNAKEFLKEQFNLCMYKYVFSGESEWTEKRIKQLQVLKDIAFKIIDFISQFEDELVKIWNKPKFVLNSNYVITLDRIADKENGINLIEKILNHKNIEEQIKEWKDLGIIEDDFDKSKVIENKLTGKQLNEKYKFLPIDTKYFKNLELEILNLFDDLDKSLDGWLIKSENYQALNTILPKFRERVQTIYIDPPYNTGKDEFIYKDRYKHSNWLTMMENRLSLAKELMSDDGVIFVSIDDNEMTKLDIIMKDKFKFLANIIWKKLHTVKNDAKNFSINTEYILCYTKSMNQKEIIKPIKFEKTKDYKYKDEKGLYKLDPLHAKSGTETSIYEYTFKNGIKWKPPAGTYPRYSIETLQEFENLGKIVFPGNEITTVDGKKIKYRGTIPMVKRYLSEVYEGKKVESLWDGKEVGFNKNTTEEFKNLFKDFGRKIKSELNPKPVPLLKKCVEISTENNDIVFDFFAGSGTTAHAVMKLNKEDGGKRKFLLVEMADYFYDIIIPRLKKIAYSLNWKDGKPQNTDGIGIFFKYYELEQYEDTLRKAKYKDSDFFDNPYEDPYNQYIFMKDLKMLEALDVDYENNKVKVNLSKLYENIDIPETLSNLLGKWIKKITADYVEFEDGEKIDIKNLDYKLIKPLIWW